MTFRDKPHSIAAKVSPEAMSGEHGSLPVNSSNALQRRPADQESGYQAKEVIAEDSTRPADDAQIGVQKIEAVTLSWSKRSMCLVLILYFCSDIVFLF